MQRVQRRSAMAVLRFATLCPATIALWVLTGDLMSRAIWWLLGVAGCALVVTEYRRLKRVLGVDYFLLPLAYASAAVFYFPETRYALRELGWLLFVELVLVIGRRHAVVRLGRRLRRALPWSLPRNAWWLLVPVHHALLLVAAWTSLTWMSPADCGESAPGVARVVTTCEVGDWNDWFRSLPNAPPRIDGSPRDAFCGRTCDTIHATFGWEDHADGLAPIVTFVKEPVRVTVGRGHAAESRSLSRWRVRGVTWATSPFAGECDPASGRCVVTSPVAGGVIVLDSDTGRVRRVLTVAGLSPSDVDWDPPHGAVMILGHGRAQDLPVVPGFREERVAIERGNADFVAATFGLGAEELRAIPLRGSTSRAANGERFYNTATDSGEVFLGPHLRIASLHDATIRTLSPGLPRLLWSGGVTCGAAFAVNPSLGVRALYVGYPFMGIGELVERDGEWEYVRTISTPDGGRSVAYDPVRDVLIQANYESGEILVIGRATGRILARIPVGDRVRHVHVRGDTLITASHAGIVQIDLNVVLAASHGV